MAAISLDHIRKSYGAHVIVDNLCIDVQAGEFLTLLGPSGCGKSTILRMIAGLDSPSAGGILFDGRRMNDVLPADRNIAMVFQSYALYPHMTVRQNLEYPLRKRRVPAQQRAAMVDNVAGILQIGPLLDRRSSQLSGGQQQRVALGRAMIRSPDVFLFDEPLSNLDATLRAHMRAEIIQLHQRLGKTMVYVTHDQIEAMTMSTRIAVLEGGKLLQLGPPAEVYARPATRFVASFVGTPRMNFLPGALVPGGFRADGLALEIAVAHAADAVRVTAGVRPQDLLLAKDGLPARVTLVERTGQETLVTTSAGAQTLVLRLDESCKLRIGDEIAIGVRPGKLHLFDEASGERLGNDDCHP
ncbi:ABC transporter ATP-binding protein [Acidisphaera sp. L21]|uniref:ABC transporter ATP-binding protein n=1 Tax=Acidisphaera sp. L21 TaxID=1641851 RepID=UPI00131BF8CA|nr:ABC transporter ATP-binding protein [Acidisphaera sp. L21]